MDHQRAPVVPGLALGRLLGAGSSGQVWTAVDLGTGATVAVKVLAGPARGEPSRRESALLRRLDHPHLLRLLRSTRTDDGRVALVTEHAPGGSLAALVQARGSLEPGEVVTLLTPLAGALADLHARGVVHGDVAPGNVLFLADGRPVLADLGTAGLLGVDPATHATPGFADPGVVAGGVMLPASDVHALGALAWFALTGAAPEPAGSRPPLGPLTPATPPALVQVVEECLHPVPGSRPEAAEVAAQVFGAADAAPVRLVPTDPRADAAEVMTHRLREAAASDAAPEATSRVRRRPGRRTWAAGVLVALVAVVAVAAAVVGVPGGDAGSTGTAAARAQGTPTTARAGAAAGRATTAPAARPGPLMSEDPAPGEDPTPDEAPLAGDDPLASDDPVSAVAALSELRAAGFAAADPAPLRSASVEGSPALAADLTTLSELVRQGVRLEGLAFGLDRVELVSRESGRATVRVSVVTGAHRVVAAEGGAVVEDVAASMPAVVRLVLQRVDGRWQVAEVR